MNPKLFETLSTLCELSLLHNRIKIRNSLPQHLDFPIWSAEDILNYLLKTHESFAVELEKERRRAQALKLRLITYMSSDYPEAFRHLDDPPAAFYLKGTVVWKSMPLLSVVGSRNPHRRSIDFAIEMLGEALDRERFGVVSGGALGIDQCVHQVAIQHERPTLCFLPSGFDHLYPSNLFEIIDDIVNGGGAVLSHFSTSAKMQKFHFLKRNQLIAMLGDALLILQGGVRSGSLMTARHAIQLGKEVGVVPHHPFDYDSNGGNILIRDGARVILDWQDILSLVDIKSVNANFN